MILALAAIAAALVFAVLSHLSDRRVKTSGRKLSGDFLLALSALMAKVAMADGILSDEETATVNKIFADMGLTRAERAMCVGNFYLAKDENDDAHALAKGIAARMNRATCTFLYGLVWQMAMADKRLDPQEGSMLRDLAEDLGLGREAYDGFSSAQIAFCPKEALRDAGVPESLLKLVK